MNSAKYNNSCMYSTGLVCISIGSDFKYQVHKVLKTIHAGRH